MFVIANIIDAVAYVGHLLVQAYILAVIAACVVSWFRVSPYSGPVRVLAQITEPVFGLVRRRLPFLRNFGSLDLAPLAVLVGLELLDLIVFRSIRQFAAAM